MSVFTIGLETPTGLRSTVMSQLVQLSWIEVPNADSYRVFYNRASGSEQMGLCDRQHSREVTSTVNTIDINVDDDLMTLFAFSTYIYTVTAVSETLGNSEESLPETFFTLQRGMTMYY